MPRQYIRTDPVDRFWKYVSKTETCWLWLGRLNNIGYGLISLPPPTSSQRNWPVQLVHRFAYELLRGPIPMGYELDHLCRVGICVNPDHLEPVSHRINVLRGTSPSARNAAKTHCPQGHPYDEANTILPKSGGRHCRQCHRERMLALVNGTGNATKTHCKYGHPFDEKNTRITKKGARHCRECARLYQAALRAARRHAVAP